MSKFKVLALSLFAAILMGAGGLSAAPVSYGFDAGHTKVVVYWNHAGLSEQHARFTKVDGTLVFDEEKPETSTLNVTIPADSIESDVPAFNGHLKGANYFDVAKHPNITFKSTKVRRTGSKTAQVTGDLTIKGITKSVTLDVSFDFSGIHPLGKFFEKYKKQYVAFSAHTRVLRSDFGLGRGAPLTSDTVDIRIDTEMGKK